jgi:UTP:GlnB (protein PII) uridylyltransferase
VDYGRDDIHTTIAKTCTVYHTSISPIVKSAAINSDEQRVIEVAGLRRPGKLLYLCTVLLEVEIARKSCRAPDRLFP